MERRLAAILIADVVGYSRLSQDDEEGTNCTLVDKAGQLPLTVGAPLVQALAQACLTRAVDQEFVSDEDLVAMLGVPLKHQGTN
jgi:hypothetical protein